MRPTDSPDEARFRLEASAWLAENAVPRVRPRITPSVIVAEWQPDEENERLAEAKSWQRTKYDAGWAGITWPEEYGGRGLSPAHDMVFREEEAAYDVPLDALGIGLGWLGPAVMVHGSLPLRSRYLPRLLRGDDIWCQMFSEPEAGSDLAALRTNAIKDGEEWVISGQKVWSTFAHRADWGVCLARTDPEVPKHRGLTAFLVDMSSSGVDARPIRQMTGGSNFNVVHIDQVRVPDLMRIGSIGEGWALVVTTFMFERNLGTMATDHVIRSLSRLARDDESLRDDVARLYAEQTVLRFNTYRVISALSAGQTPGSESSVAKLQMTRLLSALYESGVAHLGPDAMLVGDRSASRGRWQSAFLGAPGLRVGGGTDQVQLNIIGERVLGLPGEPSLDRATHH